MEIRKTTMEDLDGVMDLYEQARSFMRENGNPDQWKNNHPPREMIVHDIETGKSYVCAENGVLLGTFYYDKGVEPDYAEIQGGNWVNERPYGVIHRITAPTDRKGVASFCIDWC